MSEVTDKLIGNCFENLEKAEVLGRLLYTKFFGEKDNGYFFGNAYKLYKSREGQSYKNSGNSKQKKHI